MAQYLLDLIYNFTDCMCCFPSSPQLKINSRNFKLLRLLGEVSIAMAHLRLRMNGLTTFLIDSRAASLTSTSSKTKPTHNSTP